MSFAMWLCVRKLNFYAHMWTLSHMEIMIFSKWELCLRKTIINAFSMPLYASHLSSGSCHISKSMTFVNSIPCCFIFRGVNWVERGRRDEDSLRRINVIDIPLASNWWAFHFPRWFGVKRLKWRCGMKWWQTEKLFPIPRPASPSMKVGNNNVNCRRPYSALTMNHSLSSNFRIFIQEIDILSLFILFIHIFRHKQPSAKLPFIQFTNGMEINSHDEQNKYKIFHHKVLSHSVTQLS